MTYKQPGRPRPQLRAQREQRLLQKIPLNAAGIDIGSRSHWVSVPDDRDPQPVREFASFTHDLAALATWLEACGIDTVAMESTGVYWIPYGAKKRPRLGRCWSSLPSSLRLCRLRCSSSSSRSLAG